jgi:colicin import membrane protein
MRWKSNWCGPRPSPRRPPSPYRQRRLPRRRHRPRCRPAPPPPKPDIAIKEKEKPKPPPPKPVPVPTPRIDPFQEQLKREAEQLTQRKQAETAAQELAQVKAGQVAAARNKAVADYLGRIRARFAATSCCRQVRAAIRKQCSPSRSCRTDRWSVNPD